MKSRSSKSEYDKVVDDILAKYNPARGTGLFPYTVRVASQSVAIGANTPTSVEFLGAGGDPFIKLPFKRMVLRRIKTQVVWIPDFSQLEYPLSHLLKLSSPAPTMDAKSTGYAVVINPGASYNPDAFLPSVGDMFFIRDKTIDSIETAPYIFTSEGFAATMKLYLNVPDSNVNLAPGIGATFGPIAVDDSLRYFCELTFDVLVE